MKPSFDLQNLLAEFSSGRNRDANFRKIADHLSGLIYHSALRQGRDAGMAEEVTQSVLLLISRKAGKLARHPRVLAWVHEATRLEVMQMKRAAGRRKKREEEAMMINENTETNLALLDELDQSLNDLSEAERELVLMRFFEGRTFPAIAARTGRSESAEKMRLKRALEKMAGWFGKKGVTLSVAGLAAVLSTEMAKGAPVGLVTVASVAAVGAGSGKLAGGVALLVAAGFAVPILSSWGEVREMEERLEVLSGSETTRSARSGRVMKRERGVGRMIRLADEKMSLDEIMKMAIRSEAIGNRLEAEVLKRQLARLELEKVVWVAEQLRERALTRSSWHTGETLVLAELKSRLEEMDPREKLAFLIPLRISIELAVKEFANWSKSASIDEVGMWLRENDELLKEQAWGSAHQTDLKGQMWECFLMKCAGERIEVALDQLRVAPLSAAQKAEWVNDTARGIQYHEEVVVREYQSSVGELRQAWRKLIVRKMGDNLERVGEWMSDYDLEEDDRVSLLDEILRSFHSDLRKKSFPERLEWLQRNVPVEKWGDLVNSRVVQDFDSKAAERGLADGFEEAFIEMEAGMEKAALAYAAASLLISSGGFDNAQQVAKTFSFVSQMTDDEKRERVILIWTNIAKREKPEMLPAIEEALRKASWYEEGGSE